MTKFASRAQKWYTTGQPRAAFDVRGWQKLPEYALIRIPAGAQNCRFSPVFPVQKVADFPRRKNGQKLPDFRCAKLPLFCVHTRASELFSCVRRENLFSVRSVWRNFFFVNTLRDRKSFFCWRTTNSVVVVLSVACCTLFLRVHTFCKCAHTQRAQHWKHPVRANNILCTRTHAHTRRAHRAQPKHDTRTTTLLSSAFVLLFCGASTS